MKKAGIITFHAAHNYGSSLQAYAMQKTVESLGVSAEIINFRTERQRDQYTPLTKRKGFKYIIKNAYFLLNYKNRKKKYDKFEAFIDEKLVKSENEYKSLSELENADLTYDFYISGSDQIWNTALNDSDMSYFLPFVKSGKRISYAPSFGQRGIIEKKQEISEYLQRYDCLSVREEYGVSLVKEMTGKTVPVVADPTMLISRKEWENLAESRIVEEDYIFFYSLFATKEMICIAKRLSQQLGLPVVISNISNQYEIFSGFKKQLTAGPCEFLSLVKHASLVCATSFHAVVFSIILNKPFFAINGMNDNRISTLLNITGLCDRSVDVSVIDEKIKYAYNIDFTDANKALSNIAAESIDYLRKSLNLEENR